ncbi:MAG: DUF933 domain-containing protein [Endomicrobiia bacterium]|nr:DUF933 domain-containing protein [Endomicrobiia bacterium]
MKISFFGINLLEGKIKYHDAKMTTLVEKCNPVKISPFFVELAREEFARADAIIATKTGLLDLLIHDMEKIEARLLNASDEAEKNALKTALSFLEKETPLCDATLTEEASKYLKILAPVSMKPVARSTAANADAPTAEETNEAIKSALEKSDTIFFYTAGPKEVHAWPIRKGSSIVEGAGKIHSDLARGFIKADIVSFEDFLSAHNMNDARDRGLVKVVGRDYIIREGDIIEIRSGV